MYICPKCGSPTNCKQYYTYYWITDIDTGIPYMEKQPYGLYHECRKCPWTDQYNYEPDYKSKYLLTPELIRDAFKQLGVDLNEDEN